MVVERRSNSVRVQIETPEGVILHWTPEDALRDLIEVRTHEDLREAADTFHLVLAPRQIEGKTYDQLIPLNSLVWIWMHDPLAPTSDDEALVMLGRTEDQGLHQNRTSARLEGAVTISGRSIGAVLLDTRLFYHPGLENKDGTLTDGEQKFNLFWPNRLLDTKHELDPRQAIATVLHYLLGLQQAGTPPPVSASNPAPAQATGATMAGLLREQMIADLRSHFPDYTREQAEAQADRLLNWPLPGREVVAPPSSNLPFGSAQPPATPPPTPPALAPLHGRQLIQPRYRGRALADLLQMNNAAWSLFEDNVTISAGLNPAFAGSLWNYVQVFVDSLFQEFFTRVEDGACKIHFRRKPFRKDPIAAGSRFVTDEPTCPTVTIDRAALLTIQQRRMTTEVFNCFLVIPQGSSTQLKEPSFRYRCAPIIFTSPDHPSSVLTYGLRLLEHGSPYLSAKPTLPDTAPTARDDYVVATAQRWGQIAANWYGYAPDLYSGTLTVPGSPRYKKGMRVFSEATNVEAYLEGVDRYFNAQTRLFTCTLRLTRIWNLSGPVDDRGVPGVALPVPQRAIGAPRSDLDTMRRL
jgi:hypothetical protein